MVKLAMSIPDAAIKLCISKKHAYELARRGELPGVFQLGRRKVVNRRALEEAMGANEQAKFELPFKPDVPVTFLPYQNNIVQMLGADPCASGPDKIHCPYCGGCDLRGHEPFQLCRDCWGKFTLQHLNGGRYGRPTERYHGNNKIES